MLQWYDPGLKIRNTVIVCVHVRGTTSKLKIGVSSEVRSVDRG